MTLPVGQKDRQGGGETEDKDDKIKISKSAKITTAPIPPAASPAAPRSITSSGNKQLLISPIPPDDFDIGPTIIVGMILSSLLTLLALKAKKLCRDKRSQVQTGNYNDNVHNTMKMHELMTL